MYGRAPTEPNSTGPLDLVVQVDFGHIRGSDVEFCASPCGSITGWAEWKPISGILLELTEFLIHTVRCEQQVEGFERLQHLGFFFLT